jgi:polyribonucleotide 5'-hydroxyl-kinase
LPIGVKAQHDSLRVVRVPFANRDELANSIMAVSYCSPSNMNSADLLCQSNVAGFVYCQGVDLTKARMMLLAPCPGPLPAKVFLLGSLKWFDEL